MTPLVLRDVEIDGARVDVTVERGLVTALAESCAVPRGAEVIDADGGALLPGLWDHHIHLLSLAAARRSVVVGPPDVSDAEELGAALRGAAVAGRWIRAVGYHESVAGDLDRDQLDRLVPEAPVRVQHRSGAKWTLNSAALDQLGLDAGAHETGVEVDAAGRPTGRLYGADRLLRARLGEHTEDAPDLTDVGRELASYGVTGVTDATPYEHVRDLDHLAGAAAAGALPQRVVATGGPGLTASRFPAPLLRGPVKLLLADHGLPSLDELVGWIRTAHDHRRAVAVHCVTRTSLALTLAALDVAGAAPGDRIEHGAVVPPEMRSQLAAQRLTVVTQPNFVAERGDDYLADVDPEDLPHLYPCRALVEAGVAVAGSTDAPFGHPDPWRAMVAAAERRTPAGRSLGSSERLPRLDALHLFLGAPHAPGGTRRRITEGSAADLCLLDCALEEAADAPSAEHVRLTVIGGDIVHPR